MGAMSSECSARVSQPDLGGTGRICLAGEPMKGFVSLAQHAGAVGLDVFALGLSIGQTPAPHKKVRVPLVQSVDSMGSAG
jgi:hypothetical protein